MLNRKFKLRSLQVINADNRNSSVDIFRAIAIISVVMYHFNQTLPYGYLGVIVFFVISGLLVGGLLTKKFHKGEHISFLKFILQRGFKIWPSYYTFLLIGNFLAYTFYHTYSPGQYIPLWDLKRYLFFYQNFTGLPIHWCMDHIWSLCVEEHFYILLPLLFIVLQRFFKGKGFLFCSIIFIIIAGIAFKYLALNYTNSKDTFEATYDNIDALAWGVLLNLILVYYPGLLKKMKNPYLISIAGLLLFLLSLFIQMHTSSVIFHRVIFNSIVAFCFFLMIAGVYHYDFSRLKILRITAYYSYNWYLWHTVFIIMIERYMGVTAWAFITYFILTLIVAVLFTILVEEPILLNRKKVIRHLS